MTEPLSNDPNAKKEPNGLDPPPQPSDQLTEAQTAGSQAAARRLSLQATMPPADVPGVRLERFLGSGAFGQVWVGRDLNTGRGVAVKFYLHRGGVNWSLLSREVKNLVQLSADRHVVQVLEVGWDADPPYYVMELIEGGSLEEMLLKRGRLPVAEAVELFRKICIGLNHCHGKGVLHCDIKPANILIAADNEPRLADFGQSRMSHDQTPAMGTLFYMAPEQADLQSTPDARWDVYAAGAILYRMLSGNAPHRDQTLLSQLDTAGSLPGRLARYREAIAEAPSAIDQLNRPSVDRPLRQIIERSLEVDPKQRYANVQQILDDLHRRDQAHAKRSLLLLGIVGPLLILLATCVFAFRSINRATLSATSALRTEAFGSNQLAARFAAQTLETEIERYFQLAEEESSREEFRLFLGQLLDDPELSKTLQEIGASESPQHAALKTKQRDQLLDSEKHLQVDEYLTTRLKRYISGNDGPRRRQRLASMFVTDARGTIISIAYGKPVPRDQNSAGRNYAYRTYFHGQKNDLSPEVSLNSVEPLASTHLSSAFRSTATGLWKVAISTPIALDQSDSSDGDGAPQSSDPDAVFVMTINLGDFQLLQSSRGASQVAVLLEARQGNERGTVLQHPLMDRLRDSGTVASDHRYQVPDDLFHRLIEGGDVDYLDPMAEAPEGDDYAGEWIAAMQPVSLPEDKVVVNPQLASSDASADQSVEGEHPEPQDGLGMEATDLLVLVQYRLSDVLGPVGALEKSLYREVLASVASILFVTFFLWWVVRRVSNQDDHDDSMDDDDTQPPESVETMPVG